MSNKHIFITALAVIWAGFALAQNAIVKGTVKTADGSPAGFVNLAIKGTTKGAVADKNGQYEIKNIAAGDQTIVASFIGLETQEQNIQLAAGQTLTIDFTLRENAKQLAEVVVSAHANHYKQNMPSQTLRITTPILETPQNIQVISQAVLKDQQAFDMLESVQRNVSGAQKVEHWDNYARINMRGTQLTAFRNGMNVQLSPWSPLAEDMSMVERIEFVKGPAGFMLANGEPSGFYNVVTKKPTGQERGEVGFTVGSFETYRATADLDGKLSKDGKLLYRFNLMGQLKGSHRDFEYNNRYSIAPVLKYVVDDKTAVTLEYNHQFSQMSVIGSNYAFSKKGYADLPVDFTTAEANLDPTTMKDRSILAILEHQLNPNWKFTAQAAYLHFEQIGQSIWPWGISNFNDSLMQRGISIWDALGFNKNAQFFVNGKAQTGGITHSLLGGLDMSHKDYYADWNQGAALGDSTFNIYNPQYGTVAAADIPQWDRSQDIRERAVRYNNSYVGLYVQDEISFFENKLRLTLAGRYTSNKYINPYSGTTDDSKFTPRVGLSWTILENLATYAVYDEVFLANPGTDWQGKNFAPQEGVSLEWGIKKDWFGGRWNTTASVYQITRNNVLTADLEHPDPVTGQFIYSRQNGQHQTRGVEFDLRGELLENLELILNYAYTDARITKDANPEVVDNQVAGATKHIQNAWLNYRIATGKLEGLRFSLGYQYQSGRSSWYVFDGTENGLPNYFRLDGGIGYQTGKFGVNLLVNNLLDKYLYSGAPYYGVYYWQTEPLRNFRVSITQRF